MITTADQSISTMADAGIDTTNVPSDDLRDAPYTKSLLTHAHPEVSMSFKLEANISTSIKQQLVSSSGPFLKAG
jgi:hypothetical protein